jgi:acyl carrier protein
VIENFLFGKGETLSDAESLLDGGMIDSTGVLELIDFIENHYGFKVEDNEAIPQNLDGVNSIANYVCHKINSMAVS